MPSVALVLDPVDRPVPYASVEPASRDDDVTADGASPASANLGITPPARGQHLVEELDEGEALDAYSRAVTGVVEQVGPTVVSISRASRRGPAGAASGVAFTPDGYVLTNAHVVAGADEIELGFTDGASSHAHVVGV